MQIEKIYNILKSSSLEDFYLPGNAENTTFVYKEDIQLSIQKKNDEKRWGYDYFFDGKRQEKELYDKYDVLLRELCKLKNFPESYNNIEVEDWSVIFNGVHVYNISCVTITNLSSLHVSLPLSLNPLDYIANFCSILNEDHGANTMHRAFNIIDEYTNINESSIEDFLMHQ